MEKTFNHENKTSIKKFKNKIITPTFFIIYAILMIVIGLIWPLKKIITFPYNLIGISIWGSIKFNQVGTNIQTFDEPDILITDGLFKYSRNPMYFGFFMGLWGIFIILGAVSQIILVLIFMITDQLYITFEEEMMVKKFGKKYINYKAVTRKWI